MYNKNGKRTPGTVFSDRSGIGECDDTLKNMENLKNIMLKTMDFCREAQ